MLRIVHENLVSTNIEEGNFDLEYGHDGRLITIRIKDITKVKTIIGTCEGDVGLKRCHLVEYNNIVYVDLWNEEFQDYEEILNMNTEIGRWVGNEENELEKHAFEGNGKFIVEFCK
jgi:phenylpropionate dioxygenase-like ring-hydroxylating dioxygenase large terminal subunit